MEVARRNPPTVLSSQTLVQYVLGDTTVPSFQFTDPVTGAPLDMSDAPTVELTVERLMPDPAETTLTAAFVEIEQGWVRCDWDDFFLQAGTYRLQYVAEGDDAYFISPWLFVEVVDLGEYPTRALGEPANG